MKDIYGTAKEVLVWLGPDERNQARGIFDIISKTLDELVDAIHNGIEPEGTTYWLPSAEAEDRLRQLVPLLQMDWFTRTWTIQEAGLTDKPIAIWGDATVDLNKICLVCMIYLKYFFGDEVEKAGVLREVEMITKPLPDVSPFGRSEETALRVASSSPVQRHGFKGQNLRVPVSCCGMGADQRLL